MQPQSATDTFTWLGANNGSWDTPSNWTDLTTGSSPSAIAPGAGGTAIINGGAGLTINGPSTATVVDVSGAVDLDGAFNLGTVDLAANAALTFAGTAASPVITIGSLTEAGAGASLSAAGGNMTVTIDSLGTITGTLVATEDGTIDLPNFVAMNGGTLFAGPLNANIVIGGTVNYDCIGVAQGGTLSGSGALYGQFDSGLGAVNYGGPGLAVDGLVLSSGFTVYGLLEGSGTVEIVANGFFSAPVVDYYIDNLTYDIGNSATLHLSSSPEAGETIDFTGQGGIAAFYTNNYNGGGLPPAAQATLYELAPIAGFTQGDRLFGVVAVAGGLPAPVWQQNGGSGTLLFGTGLEYMYFTLRGTYTTSDFLVTSVPDTVTTGSDAVAIQIDLAPSAVYATSAGSGRGDSYTWAGPSGGAWGDAANWYDVTTGGIASVAPGAGDTASVAGSTGAFYTVITQTGSAGALSFSGNVAVEGTVAAAALTLAANGTNLLVTNGGTIVASSLSIAAGTEAFADGEYPVQTGGYIDITGAATVAAGGVLAAGYGGRVQVASLTIEGGGGTTNSVQIDSLIASPDGSAITVGTLNDAASGALMIDAGAVLTDQSPADNQSRLAEPVVDDGTLVASNLATDGLSGSGSATVVAGGVLDAGALAAGSTVSFVVDSGASLEIGAGSPNTAPINGDFTLTGTNDSLFFDIGGTITNLYVPAAITGFGFGDSLEIELDLYPAYVLNPIVSASFSQTDTAGGTLALLGQSGTEVGSLNLLGTYAADSFIVTPNDIQGYEVNIVAAETGQFGISAGTSGGDSFTYNGPSGGAWGDASNWTEATPSVPAVAPGANDSITIGSGSNGVAVITGSGDAAIWTLGSNAAAVAGDFSVGTLVAIADTLSQDTLYVDADGTLTVGTASFSGFYTPLIVVDGAGALLDITGALTGSSIFGSPITSGAFIAENGGTIAVGSLAFSVFVTSGAGFTSGSLPFAADGGGTLILPTSVPSASTPITLSGTSNVLDFDTPSATALAVTPSISGFAVTDTIDVTFAPIVSGITIAQESSAGLTIDLVNAATQTVGSLSLSGDYLGDTFYSAELPGGTTEIALTPLCFLAGTLIATPTGETEVERLAAGDLVVTARGDIRPIAWVGTGRVLATRGRRGPATPVIVRKGALGDNVPHTDLRVTKGHALCLDDVLIPVEFLVNHRSILWDDHAQEVAIHHIELETHDVLLASGAPAESYRDDGNRWLFQNANSGWGLPPQAPCAPVLTGGPVVDAIWQRLLERAGTRRAVPMTDDPDVHLVVDGRRLDAAEQVGGVCVFRLTKPPSALCIVSRAAAPAELGLARDPRNLGVAVRRLVVRKGNRFVTVSANDGRLTHGFHAFEPDFGFRWTDGDAVIPAELYADFRAPFEVVLHIGATTLYLDDGHVRKVA
jgi:hypothetical protein